MIGLWNYDITNDERCYTFDDEEFGIRDFARILLFWQKCTMMGTVNLIFTRETKCLFFLVKAAISMADRKNMIYDQKSSKNMLLPISTTF